MIALIWRSDVDAKTPLREGKSISIFFFFKQKTAYEIWSRLLAAHMGKHIPGNPGMIAQNMPGAGSMIAANHIFNVAKPDGLSLGSIGPSLYLDQLAGKNAAHFPCATLGCVASTPTTP